MRVTFTFLKTSTHTHTHTHTRVVLVTTHDTTPVPRPSAAPAMSAQQRSLMSGGSKIRDASVAVTPRSVERLLQSRDKRVRCLASVAVATDFLYSIVFHQM